MNYIKVAWETIRITSEGQYIAGDKAVMLPEGDYTQVMVFSPEDGQALLEEDITEYFDDGHCDIHVINTDSFGAAGQLEEPLVMNFANSHSPGGGFLSGAAAQEESLCRCSTLYASLSSKKAKKMYNYNNTHLSKVASDYMLLSPEVWVFRNRRCELLEQPFKVGVMTLPAPNRNGAAMLAKEELIEETMTRRIRIMLRIAAKHGYKDLVLGAWGCGAFRNSPEKVSEYFRKVLIDEEYGRCFDHVLFAICGKPGGRNITAFRKTFEG